MKRIPIFFLLLFPLLVKAQVYYHNVADSLGIYSAYNSNYYGGGVSFADINQDGWDDLTIATAEGDTIEFYLNNEGHFTKVDPPLVVNTKEVKQILWADFDNDGDKDLFLAGFITGNHLYENNGWLEFTDITARSGIRTGGSLTYGATWGDIDNDGLLDLYVTNRVFNNNTYSNYLYRNLGNGTFEDITVAAGVADSFKAPFMPAFFDYNNDGWQDIYIAQDKFLINSLFRNNGDNTFTEVGSATGADLAMNGMCVAVGDYDNNSWFDLHITNTDAGNKLLRNDGLTGFTELADTVGVGFNGFAWGSQFLDADNDMDLDLYVSGQIIGSDTASSCFYQNDGTGYFNEPNNVGFIGDTVKSYANALGDFNNDGYPDIAVVNQAPFNFQLWKNSGGSNNWLKVHLQGTTSNRDGIGSLIEVFAGGEHYQRYTHSGLGYISQNSDYVLLGLGSHTIVDSLRVTWLSREVNVIKTVNANQLIKVVEGCNRLIEEVVNVLTVPPYCEGDEVELKAQGFTDYQWSTGESWEQIAVTTGGIYQVTVSDSTGCTFWEQVQVNFSETPSVQLSMDTGVFCHIDANAVELVGMPAGGTYSGLGVQGNTFLPIDADTIGEVRIFYTYTTPSGCAGMDSLMVTVELCTDVEEHNGDGFVVFPNPFDNGLLLQSSHFEMGTIAYLYDHTGKLVHTQVLDQQVTRLGPLSHLSKGIYLLQVVGEGQVFHQKLLKY